MVNSVEKMWTGVGGLGLAQGGSKNMFLNNKSYTQSFNRKKRGINKVSG